MSFRVWGEKNLVKIRPAARQQARGSQRKKRELETEEYREAVTRERQIE